MVGITMAGLHTETVRVHRRQALRTRASQRRGPEVVRILHCYVEACRGRDLALPGASGEIPQVLADQPVRRVEVMCPLSRLPPSSAP